MYNENQKVCPFSRFADCREYCALYDHDTKQCGFHRIMQELIKLNERG